MRGRITYANVMATIAVFLALGGGAYALKLGKNSVKARQIAKGAVGTSEVKNNALTGTDINETTLALASFFAGYLKSGDTAGGDLTGTYPDPDIGSGQVGPSKFGNIPAVRATTPTESAGILGCTEGQPISSGSNQALDLGDEDFDTTDMHALAVDNGPSGCDVTDTSKLIASRDGIWAVEAGVVWPDNDMGSRFLAIRKNGNSNIASSRVPAVATGNLTRQSVAGLVRINNGDYVEAIVGTTDSLSLDGTLNDTFLSMHWVAPG